MASHSLASLPTSGLYGASGWIEDNGILQLMRPYVDSPSICADFARFSGVNGRIAQEVRPLLPVDNLADRQNNAPPLDLFFEAAFADSHVLLGGYLVLSPRWDERMSIERLQERLGFDGYCRPDECEPIACMDEAHGPGWWLWWD